ncbi:PQQ-binding-like beta-propeller repeat protein [Actinoplanes regularis]|uniref:outer membrane protein assembly factor BamB family protein n=1 Tax=Actinoplanes regularis TaxID=52697 RepID=UPI0024A5CC26|nr:PQQ-binding-like beta-propeller repeat protein [Actinoplanes regularis]GLW29835.1 hypothetical protein Areg01_27750 [Actinoplanes regularis]
MAIIELGDVSAPDFVEEPATAARPLSRRGLSRLVAAALALLCAAALTGSGRPAPPALAESWSVQIGSDAYLFPFGDLMLINQDRPGSNLGITAYDLATGEKRWTAEGGTGPLAGWLNPDLESNQLYSPEHSRTVQQSDFTNVFGIDTKAVDGDTGAVLWRHTGDQMAATTEQVLLGDRDELGRVTRLYLVRARDGAPIWDRVIAPALNVAVSDGPADSTRIVYGAEAGTLTTLRYTDGVPLATRRVTPPTLLNWLPQMVNGQFFDVRGGVPERTVTVYQTDTLTELWRYDTSGDLYVQDCGPVLCFGEGLLITGVDPATGARRWQLPGNGVTPIAGGRLLIGSPERQDEQSLVDASTGRVIRAAPDDSTILALDDGDLLALRNTRTAPYRVAVSLWDPATGRSIMLGAVPGQADSCQVAGRRLLCQRAGRIGVTDLG